MEYLKEIKDEYIRAKTLVEEVFNDKKDKAGKPYIDHLMRVSNKMDNIESKIAGLLHDSIEDIDYINEEYLKKLNFSQKVIDIVKLVTKSIDEDYHDFISKIIDSNNLDAIKLKYYDMCDNLSENRLSELSKEEQEYLKNKYNEELVRLKNVLKGRD